MDKLTPRKKFRQLLEQPGYFMAPGVWDPFSARVCEALGVKCVHLGGYQMGVGTVISEPLMTLTEVAALCHYTTAAVNIPVFVDAGTGFGEPLHVMRTVRELEKTGIAGCHIEDQIFPKRAHYHQGVEHVVSRQEFLDKIKAALDARTDPDFFIMARTDAMATEGFEEGIERANMCLEAGAEIVMLFPNSLDEARRAPREVKGPVCFVNSEGNRLKRPVFTTKEFAEMGYKTSTNPTALLCNVTKEMKRVVTHMLAVGNSGSPPDEMIALRKECETLIGLDEYYKIERATVEH